MQSQSSGFLSWIVEICQLSAVRTKSLCFGADHLASIADVSYVRDAKTPVKITFDQCLGRFTKCLKLQDVGIKIF